MWLHAASLGSSEPALVSSLTSTNCVLDIEALAFGVL